MKNMSLQFNGTSTNINAGDVLDIGTQNFSIECWVKYETVRSDMRCILSKSYAGAAAFRYWVSLEGRKVRFASSWSDQGHYDYIGTKDTPLNEWFHIAITLERSSVMTIYINGEVDKSFAISGYKNVNLNSPFPFRIGAYTGADKITPNTFFDGKLTEMRIWNKDLSQDEIKKRMLKRAKGYEENLIAYFPLREGSGNQANEIVSGRISTIASPLWASDAPMLIYDKYLVKHESDFKIFNEQELLWQIIGADLMLIDGMDSLNPIRRKVTAMKNSEMNKVDDLTLYSKTINLHQLLDIRKIEVK